MKRFATIMFLVVCVQKVTLELGHKHITRIVTDHPITLGDQAHINGWLWTVTKAEKSCHTFKETKDHKQEKQDVVEKADQ